MLGNGASSVNHRQHLSQYTFECPITISDKLYIQPLFLNVGDILR